MLGLIKLVYHHLFKFVNHLLMVNFFILDACVVVKICVLKMAWIFLELIFLLLEKQLVIYQDIQMFKKNGKYFVEHIILIALKNFKKMLLLI